MRQQAEFMLLIISQSASEITKKYPKIFKKTSKIFKKHPKFFKKIDRKYFPYYNSKKKNSVYIFGVMQWQKKI
jgi:hypothetical protein